MIFNSIVDQLRKIHFAIGENKRILNAIHTEQLANNELLKVLLETRQEVVPESNSATLEGKGQRGCAAVVREESNEKSAPRWDCVARKLAFLLNAKFMPETISDKMLADKMALYEQICSKHSDIIEKCFKEAENIRQSERWYYQGAVGKASFIGAYMAGLVIKADCPFDEAKAFFRSLFGAKTKDTIEFALQIRKDLVIVQNDPHKEQATMMNAINSWLSNRTEGYFYRYPIGDAGKYRRPSIKEKYVER